MDVPGGHRRSVWRWGAPTCSWGAGKLEARQEPGLGAAGRAEGIQRMKPRQVLGRTTLRGALELGLKAAG